MAIRNAQRCSIVKKEQDYIDESISNKLSKMSESVQPTHRSNLPDGADEVYYSNTEQGNFDTICQNLIGYLFESIKQHMPLVCAKNTKQIFKLWLKQDMSNTSGAFLPSASEKSLRINGPRRN